MTDSPLTARAGDCERARSGAGRLSRGAAGAATTSTSSASTWASPASRQRRAKSGPGSPAQLDRAAPDIAARPADTVAARAPGCRRRTGPPLLPAGNPRRRRPAAPRCSGPARMRPRPRNEAASRRPSSQPAVDDAGQLHEHHVGRRHARRKRRQIGAPAGNHGQLDAQAVCAPGSCPRSARRPSLSAQRSGTRRQLRAAGLAPDLRRFAREPIEARLSLRGRGPDARRRAHC